nr:hypothetical protein [Tanacetum cinerariifolium]
QISPNSTNTFSAVGHSNAAASLTYRKSSYADFNNLETSITVSPIPTTRVHKDHLMIQIIGDLSSATQTRSMTRVAKDQVLLALQMLLLAQHMQKSSCIDTSLLPDDPNMPKLKYITYSNDEDDVGADANFDNLETSITVSPIPTTRVHKDHPLTQIISDLSSATQTRSMIKVAKDQGGLSQINNDDFHTCMFSCFLSQEEPKRVHQALKDPS